MILAAHSSMALAQLTGVPNIEYDARQFAWIGRIASGGHDLHYTWRTANVSRFEDLLVREVIVGGTGPTPIRSSYRTRLTRFWVANSRCCAATKAQQIRQSPWSAARSRWHYCPGSYFATSTPIGSARIKSIFSCNTIQNGIASYRTYRQSSTFRKQRIRNKSGACY